MIMYSLAFVHDTPCIPSLTSSTMYECCVLNGAVHYYIIVVTHGAIQVVYCHYVLIPLVDVKFLHLCFKQEDQLIESTTKE